MFAPALFLLTLAHPFHVSVAEAQWNNDRSRLQIALRLSPRDLDAVLSQASGRRVVLEKESDEKTKELLIAYLRDRVYLSSSQQDATTRDAEAVDQRRRRFHWVGVEDEVRYVWVYFELERPVGSDSVWLSNRVMFETEPTQINTLQLLRSDPPIAVRTTRDNPTQALE